MLTRSVLHSVNRIACIPEVPASTSARSLLEITTRKPQNPSKLDPNSQTYCWVVAGTCVWAMMKRKKKNVQWLGPCFQCFGWTVAYQSLLISLGNYKIISIFLTPHPLEIVFYRWIKNPKLFFKLQRYRQKLKEAFLLFLYSDNATKYIPEFSFKLWKHSLHLLQ